MSIIACYLLIALILLECYLHAGSKQFLAVFGIIALFPAILMLCLSYCWLPGQRSSTADTGDGYRHPFAIWFTCFTPGGIQQGQCSQEIYYPPKDEMEFESMRQSIQQQVLQTNAGYVTIDHIQRED